ncbi:MAG: hypothetical protein QME96_01030 [Myxococcota bacterium]|nr:hypothetical protein [Myxococcota bacterium]
MSDESTKQNAGSKPAAESCCTETHAGGGKPLGKPMARLAARIAFCLGALSLVGGIVIKFITFERITIAPSRMLLLAVVWLLISATILLAEIERKTGDK